MMTPYKTIRMQNPWKCPYDYFTMAIKNCCGLRQIFEVSSMKMTSKGLIRLCFFARFGDPCVFCFVGKSHSVPLCCPKVVEIRL